MQGVGFAHSLLLNRGKFAMKNADLCALVWKTAEPFAKAAGCEIWDVKFFKEAGQWLLRVVIDRPDGTVDTDACEAVSRPLSDALDALDPIEQSYCLEVSSPGICRELYRDGDFDRFAGSSVDVKLYKADAAGRKVFTAVLAGRDGETLNFEEKGKTFSLEKSEIASCRIHFDF